MQLYRHKSAAQLHLAETYNTLMASSGVGSMQFFSSGLRAHSPRKLQHVIWVPKVRAIFSSTQSRYCALGRLSRSTPWRSIGRRSGDGRRGRRRRLRRPLPRRQQRPSDSGAIRGRPSSDRHRGTCRSASSSETYK